MTHVLTKSVGVLVAYGVLLALTAANAHADPARVLLRVRGEGAELDELAIRLESSILGQAGGTLAFADVLEVEAAVSDCRPDPAKPDLAKDRSCRLEMARRLFVEHVLELSGATNDADGAVVYTLAVWDPDANAKLFVEQRELAPGGVDEVSAVLASAYLCFRGVAARCLPSPGNRGTAAHHGAGRLEIRDIGPVGIKGVEILVAGKRVGRAPATLLGLPEGDVEVVLQAPGFLPHTQRVALAADADVVLEGIVLARRACDLGDQDDCGARCTAGETWACVMLGELGATRFGPSYDPVGAEQRLTALCAGGEVESCVALGRLALQERGASALSEAEARFRDACDAGNMDGCHNLGLLTYRWARQPKRAEPLLQQACDGGVARACHALSEIYQDGWLFWGDEAVAEPDLLTPPADAERLDFAYGPHGSDRWSGWKEGERAPARPAEAFAYARKGCELGSGSACWEVAMLYHLGSGVRRDPLQSDTYQAQALRLFEQECELGIPKSCWTSGEQPESQYHEGRPAAIERARWLWQTACDRGDGNACVWLTMVLRFYTEPRQLESARAVAQRLCDADPGTYEQEGRAGGCAVLADMTSEGAGGAKDEDAASRYRARSCLLGDSLSCARNSGGCASCAVTRARARAPWAGLLGVLVTLLGLLGSRRPPSRQDRISSRKGSDA